MNDLFESSGTTSTKSTSTVSLFPLCGSCGLKGKRKEPTFDHSKKILVVVESYEAMKQFILQSEIAGYDKDYLEQHTNIVYSIKCGDEKPTTERAFCCFPNLLRSITDNTQKILLIGDCPIATFIKHFWGASAEPYERWTGSTIPIWEKQCFMFPITSTRRIESEWNKSVQHLLISKFQRELSAAFEFQGNISNFQRFRLDALEQVTFLVFNLREAKNALFEAMRAPFSAFDFETNCIKPEKEKSKIRCVSVSVGYDKAYCFPWTPAFEPLFIKYLQSDVPKVAANMKFEDKWCNVKLHTPVNNWTFDTMLGHHIEDSGRGTKSLKYQAFRLFGVKSYNGSVEHFFETTDKDGYNQIDEILLNDLMRYCAIDSLLEAHIYESFRKEIPHGIA